MRPVIASRKPELSEILEHLAKKIKIKQERMWEEEERLASKMREKVLETPQSTNTNFYKVKKIKKATPVKKKRANISNINVDQIKKRRKGNHKFIDKMIKSHSVVLKRYAGGYKKKYCGVDMKKKSKKFLTKKYLYQQTDESCEEKLPTNDIESGYLSFYNGDEKCDDFGIDYYVGTREGSETDDKENSEIH